MEIKKLTTLDRKQVIKVLELINQCKGHEPINIAPTLSNEGNFDPNIPCLYLLEENDFLMSFLCLYMPNPYYGEAVCFTFPGVRKRGYFKKLWEIALKELEASGKADEMELMVLTDGKSIDAQLALKSMGMERQYTEYLLSKPLVPSDRPVSLTAEPIDANNPKDANAIFMLHETIFSEGRTASTAFVQSTKQEYIQSYIVKHNENTVGLFHLALDGDRVFLFGFGILPAFQGKGYGKQMVDLAIRLSPEGYKEMGLQVSSYSETAYNLYRGCGFSEKSRIEYFFQF